MPDLLSTIVAGVAVSLLEALLIKLAKSVLRSFVTA